MRAAGCLAGWGRTAVGWWPGEHFSSPQNPPPGASTPGCGSPMAGVTVCHLSWSESETTTNA